MAPAPNAVHGQRGQVELGAEAFWQRSRHPDAARLASPCKDPVPRPRNYIQSVRDKDRTNNHHVLVYLLPMVGDVPTLSLAQALSWCDAKKKAARAFQEKNIQGPRLFANVRNANISIN